MSGTSGSNRQGRDGRRWATQRVPTEDAGNKRNAIRRAISKRRNTAEKGQDGDAGHGSEQSDDSESTEVDEGSSQRSVFVNQPLPPQAIDEDGSPLQSFSRKKIRTAKYTPLIFVPKNLWLQFHNVANVYFLFVTILAVRSSPSRISPAIRLLINSSLDISHFWRNQSRTRRCSPHCYSIDYCHQGCH